MCKVNTGYYGTSEIKNGLSTCTVNNPLAEARGLLSLHTGTQTMLYLSLVSIACLHCCFSFAFKRPFTIAEDCSNIPQYNAAKTKSPENSS